MEKIVQMAEVDQRVRLENPIDWKKVNKIDEENRLRIKNLVKTYGLIDIKRFGKKASYSAWLLIQHFPQNDLPFMKKYLSLMEKSLSSVDIKNYAYLLDRVNSYQGRPQVYGTQLIMEKGNDYWEFEPISKITKVDARRKDIGLEPLRKYAKKLEKTYKQKVNLPRNYREKR